MGEQARSDRSAGAGGRERAAGAGRGGYGRRAVLAGAAAAGVGAVAGLAGGTGAAQAADGSPVELGETNHASATTWVITSSGTGLAGRTSTAHASGVAGIDDGGTGTGNGVYGRSTTGTGVYGTSADGQGVLGASTVGYGVFGTSGVHGVGVVAANENLNGGLALQVIGQAEFTTTGVVTVKKGHSSVTVSASWVSSEMIVLATIQELQAGVYLAAAKPGSGKFTISLNKAATADLPVGWFVISRP
jgi:hypothetical protein